MARFTPPQRRSRKASVALAVLGAAVVFAAATPAQAALIVYEGFDTGAANNAALSGLAGATSIGFDSGSAWTSIAAPASQTYQTAGLSLSNLAVTGGNAYASGSFNIQGKRALNVTATGTLYTSSLVQLSGYDAGASSSVFSPLSWGSGSNANEQYYTSAKEYGQTYGGARITGNGYTTAGTGTALTLNTTYILLNRVTNVGGSSPVSTQWILTAAQFDNFKASGLTDAELDAATVGTGSTNVYQKHVYSQATGPTLSLSDSLGFQMYSNGAGKFDELRIGTSLDFVTPLAGGTPAFTVSPSTVSLTTLKGAVSVSATLTLTNTGTDTGDTTTEAGTAPLSVSPTTHIGIAVTGTANSIVSLATANYASGSEQIDITQNAATSNYFTTVSYNVGNAAVGTGNTFGTALTGTSNGADLSSITSNTEAIAISIDSTNSVTMDWRSAKPAEPFIVGDVVRIDTVNSDIYVLKMTYGTDVNENAFFLGRELGINIWGAAGNEMLYAKQFNFTYDQGAVGLSDDLGRWGIVTAGLNGGYVWAVVQGDGTFAVIPEPASLSILALGGLALLARRRRA